ncbi:hypothetical protein JTB14_030433 [Gonioctena quinquepunctata]|nr:hypothetical protein JTB14_030433 [Gonioctena quinquepunctata]
MSTDVAPVRAIPGRSINGRHCRSPDCNEIETSAHVRGYCRKGSSLRNARHHRVRTLIADELRKKKVHEEISCVAIDGSTRRVDIIGQNRENKTGYILDPTIRYEISDTPEEVDMEKKTIYESTIPYFTDKYG